MRSILVAILALTTISTSVLAQAPDSLSFQGYVTDPGGVAINTSGVSMTFKLYEGSTEIWSETQPSVKVDSGVFNVLLGSVTALDSVRFNRPLLLGIKVGGDSEISPRTPLAAAAYAKALPGLYTFYHENGGHKSYNVVGGAANNVVGAGVTGATIGGGGGYDFLISARNRVLDDWGTIGGGANSTASGLASTIGGGFGNTASADSSTVGGGSSNTASGGGGATVGGGLRNTASVLLATIGGGSDNVVSGVGATVPGGSNNYALGETSFAAGTRAKANHKGTFVWKDGSNGGFLTSTANFQFLIQASGGVGINTNLPLNGSALHVDHVPNGVNSWSVVVSNPFSSFRTGMRLSDDGFFEITNNANADGPNFARLNSTGNWTVVSDRRLKTGIEPASGLLEAALELEPVRYHFKNLSDQGEKSLGVIGQQVQDVVPSLVTEGELLSVNYSGLSVVAIGAIQGLYELVQELQAENAEMRAVMERAGLE